MDVDNLAFLCNITSTGWSITVIFEIFTLIVLLLMSALISGSETAFFSLNEKQISECKTQGKNADLRIVKLLGKPNYLLATILIVNNLVNVAIVTLSTFTTWHFVSKESGDSWVMLVLTIAITAAIVFFGEVVPKVFAQKKNLQFARFTSMGLVFANTILFPFSWMLANLTEIINRRFESKGFAATNIEINTAVELSSSSASKDEKDLIKAVVNFSHKSVTQVMISRLDIVALNQHSDFEKVKKVISECSFSRIPIYKDTIDTIIGLLYIKDLLPFIEEDNNFDWKNVIREHVHAVPENKKIDDLLKEFQAERVHMAIVIDEYGGTSGLITLEDIVEEIVGDIADEFDHHNDNFKVIKEDLFEFQGKTSLTDFSKALNINTHDMDSIKNESESLGGLMLELFERIPSVGEKIDILGLIFTVKEVDEKHIKTVTVTLKKKNAI